MTMPDDAPQTGQRVWRCGRCFDLFGETMWLLSPDVPCPYPHDEGTRRADPFMAHSLDPKALAEMRDEFDAIISLRDYEDRRDRLAAYLADLGLTPPEPKEGGA